MNLDTIQQLLELNQQFYQTFAEQFSATRGRLQPGVLRVLETISAQAIILDLGCGNGELGRELARRGHLGQYLGLDFSSGLLDAALAGVQGSPNIAYAQADLTATDWPSTLIRPPSTVPGESAVSLQSSSFNFVFAFAALHHLPDDEVRRNLLRKIHTLLSPGGHFIHSNWQFLNSPRLKARIQPWDTIGMDDADMDPGDYLLDWRRGGYGLRYVHHFSEDELRTLAAETGFQVLDWFYSDGQEGNLGLYQIWKKI